MGQSPAIFKDIKGIGGDGILGLSTTGITTAEQNNRREVFLSHECAVVLPKKLIEEAAEGDKDSDIHFKIIIKKA